MKKILITMCLAVPLSLYAQKFTPKVAFDHFLGGYDVLVSDHILHMGDFRTRLGLDFDWKMLKIFTDSHTYMDWGGNMSKPSFSPIQSQWFIGAQVKVNSFAFKYEHLCIHPVKVFGRKDADMYGGYNMVSVSYNY